MNYDLVVAFIRAIEKRELCYEHSLQVAILSTAIAEKMGFREQELELIKYAGLLHDVGKIGIPEAILRKPDLLTEEEWKIIRYHPQQSVEIIKPIKGLQQIQHWILYHHERWDGKGYPEGKRGEQIPIQSRILAVSDTYSAMVKDRPYRKALFDKDAREEIARVAGIQLDPKIVNVFLNLPINEINKIFLEIFKGWENVDTTYRVLHTSSGVAGGKIPATLYL